MERGTAAVLTDGPTSPWEFFSMTFTSLPVPQEFWFFQMRSVGGLAVTPAFAAQIWKTERTSGYSEPNDSNMTVTLHKGKGTDSQGLGTVPWRHMRYTNSQVSTRIQRAYLGLSFPTSSVKMLTHRALK